MHSGKPTSHFTTNRPVAVMMVFTAAVVFGFFSFKRLPVTLMPELNYPTLTVRTEFPGAAPEEVENEISRPIEEALGVIGGLNKISSVSRSGLSDVVLEFNWGTEMSKATQEALEKLDLVFLPREAERPLILHFDPSLDPIMELSLSGEGDRFPGEEGLRRLRRLADLEIKRLLEPIKGVAAVRVRGGLEEEFHVLLDKSKIVRSGLSIQTAIDRLRQENINVAGGTLKEGRAEYMIRTLNEYQTLDEIRDTVVMRYQDRAVRIRDLGSVVSAHKERQIITKTDGAESVQIDIYKEADANMVAVAKEVTRAVGVIEDTPVKKWFRLPIPMPSGPPPALGLAQHLHREEGARLAVVADRSLFIESSISEVRNTAIIGGILAVLVLYLFLSDAKTTAIIGASIPVSVLITFAPLNLSEVTLNIMSLGGLALGVGMLVDSSIVVLESIFRCRQEGDGIITAAIRGTTEVKGAVVASTLTTIAVFFPMVFVEGIAGQAFGALGLAVVVSLVASLIVAIYLIPMLASRQGMHLQNVSGAAPQWRRFYSVERFVESAKGASERSRLWVLPYGFVRMLFGAALEVVGKLCIALFTSGVWVTARLVAPALSFAGKVVLGIPTRIAGSIFARVGAIYPKIIEWTLDHPMSVAGVILVTGWVTWTAASSMETELLPEVHQREFTFEASLPIGTPIEETSVILEKVEQAILADKRDIKALITSFGYDVTNIKRSDEGEHSARFKVLLAVSGDPVEKEEQVLRRLREKFSGIPDLEVRVVRPVLFSSKSPIVVEIQGDDLVVLKKMSARAEALMSGIPALADVEASLRSGAPEIQISYNRHKLALYGLNIGTVAAQVRDMVKGFEATRFNMKDRRIPIFVRLQEADREQLDDIARLIVNPGGSEPIPLKAVAELSIGEGPSEIRRVDAHRIALIQANIASGSLGAAVRQIRSTFEKAIDLPPDMRFEITGQNEEWERSRGSLFLALGLSLFLVYVIMASQFESLLQPLIIMCTIPLAFFGSFVALALLKSSLSIVVFLGLIMLAGIVVNNAIVLVDYTNTLKSRGMDTRQAIVTAGTVRLRPILMTTATTVLGLVPMALGLGDGAEVRTPMALTVIFGLISSTVLTLVIIPSIYYFCDQMVAKFLRSVPAAAGAACE
ncbi:MAG: efflux RND transporter permease subunit [Verrucomicrobia bacterium]|nr:efflux RND transporter permease subunit [Verrucomicrobiota bacterium]